MDGGGGHKVQSLADELLVNDSIWEQASVFIEGAVPHKKTMLQFKETYSRIYGHYKLYLTFFQKEKKENT